MITLCCTLYKSAFGGLFHLIGTIIFILSKPRHSEVKLFVQVYIIKGGTRIGIGNLTRIVC